MLFLNEANITILLHLQKYFVIFALKDNNMLRIINKDAPFPEIYPIPERKEPTLEDKGYVRVNDELLRDNVDLIPQPGLQEAVLTCECNLIFMAGSATMGKALSTNELVLAKDEWKQIGSLLIGDKIMDVKGKEQTIIGVYPQGELQIYELNTYDGGSCRISADHLWYVYFKNSATKGHWAIMTTTDIAIYLEFDKSVEISLPTYISYKSKKRRIKSIIKTDTIEECVCIKVSSPERLFITKDYIVTHNTFSGFMKALQGLGKPNFTARLISRRLQDSKKGGSIIRDAKLIYDGFAGCEFTAGEYPTASWDIWNSAIQLIHANFNTENPGEWEDYKDYCKKNQSSYIYWDELTEIRDFKAFSYMFSRNRDNSGYGPCTVASFNPEYEHWSTDWLKAAGYIGDDWYAIPEKYGKITYFVIQGDSIRDVVFGETREEVVRKAGIEVTAEEKSYGMTPERMVKSFTYLSGTAMSNKILVNATGGGSVSNLYNVGLTERKKIKDGYFGPSDKSELTVSRTMIENLWSNPQDPSDQMYATLDVSSGKGTIDDQTKEVRKVDRCALWIWKGLTAINLEMFDGNLMELVPWIEQKLLLYKVPKKNFAFDAVAIGYYLISFTEGIPIIGNSRPITEYDQAGNIVQLGSYFNLRTQLMSKMKALLETSQVSCIIDKHKLYPTGRRGQEKELIDIMLEESNIFVLERKNRKDYYRSKDEYISRYKSSPDVFDPFFYRAVFELDARPRKEAEVELVETDYAALYQDYE